MRVGVVGSDSIHAFQWASVVNATASEESPVPLVTHDIEREAGGPAVVRPGAGSRLMSKRLTGAQVRNDPDLADLRVTCWWSPDPAGAQHFAGRLGVNNVAASLGDMADQVDLAMVCSLHGEDHYEQVMPFLERGISVFVDKPLCHSSKQAQQLIDVALQNDAVVWSSSPWHWSPAIQHLKHQLPTLGEIRSIVASAPAHAGRFFYTVHSVELIQELLGERPRWVSADETASNYVVTMGYDSPRVAIFNGLRQTHWMRHVAVYGERGYLEAEITNEQRDEGMARMVTSVLKELRKSRWPADPARLVDVVTVMEAASLAVQMGSQVAV